jgi:flagellar biosynthesis/type III secretory pathway protein FliH
LKNFRDWYSVMSTQLKKGREEGLKEGLEKGLGQGRKEECFKNAKK